VLLITQNFPPETVGGAVHNFETAEYLSKLGCRVDVLTTYPTYPYGEFKRKNRLYSKDKIGHITVMRVWTFQPANPSPKFNQRLLQYLIFPLHGFFRLIPMFLCSKRKYDVVITSHPPEPILLLGYLIKKFANVPWVVEFRDPWLEAAVSLGFISKNGIFHNLSEKLRQIALVNGNIFAYVSPVIRERFVRAYIITGKQVFCPNGVDLERYPTSDHKKRYMIYVGNIGHAHDLESLVRSLLFVKEKDLKLLIAGGGDKKPELLELVKRLGLEDTVEFIGRLSHEEVLNLISESLLGLYSQKELDFLKAAIPIKVLEYMGCGIPFVATGKGEIERLTKDSKAGVLVDSNPEAIAKAINWLIGDNDLRSEMGENGRRFVGKEYSKPEIISKLYRAIIEITT